MILNYFQNFWLLVNTLIVIASYERLQAQSENSSDLFPLQRKFDYRQEYNQTFLSEIYSQYLTDSDFNQTCDGKVSDLKENDFNRAVDLAEKHIINLYAIDQGILKNNEVSRLFDKFTYEASFQSLYNQYVSKNLVNE